MTDALFGFTGFVGGNLAKQHHFDFQYNSSNSAESSGMQFDLVVFAAAKAEKWRINQDPESDEFHIQELKTIISNIQAKKFVLISTVDVYGVPNEVSESTKIETTNLHPYGAHRLELENFTRRLFPNALVIRLPGLIGPGLKKNAVYDLLHNNQIENLDPQNEYQYYDVGNLWADIQSSLQGKLRLVNLTSPPISTNEVSEIVRGEPLPGIQGKGQPVTYDVHSLHSHVFGGKGPYTYSRESIIKSLQLIRDANQ